MDVFSLHGVRPGASQASTTAGGALHEARRAQNRIDSFERKLDRLALACQAMWELLRDSTAFGDGDILAKMEEIDLRDARRDGKMSSTVMTCNACGRKSQSHRRTCVFCGTDFPAKQHVFE